MRVLTRISLYTDKFERWMVMKKFVSWLSVFACLIVAVFSLQISKAEAETVTVSGVVQTGSTQNLIRLKCSDGVMLLKVDSDSDLSKSKNMLPGRTLTVVIKYGNDGYWHISSVKEGVYKADVQVDKKNLSTVTGIAKDAVQGDVLFFNTGDGEMQIKLDDDTDYSGCTCLVGGGSYKIKVGYGSDAYMHAVSISDNGSSATSSSGGSNSDAVKTTSDKSAPSNLKVEATVTGKIGANSTASMLYLETNDGTMLIKLDTYNSGILVLVPGAQITVGIGYSNEYWHAITIK